MCRMQNLGNGYHKERKRKHVLNLDVIGIDKCAAIAASKTVVSLTNHRGCMSGIGPAGMMRFSSDSGLPFAFR